MGRRPPREDNSRGDHSTGESKEAASELGDELSVRAPQLPGELAATQYAGHARDLTRDAGRHRRPLPVSVSGDGGYQN